ncbi:MAG: HU family DNA-binding protein [Desulfatitalea sp.]|nr:HU family DNA-binding protein [Desulfatitalea sp.]NNK01733.1 HU family DNA-binding protein [Desulfatitalea sp.]
MNKSELIDVLAENLDSKKEAAVALESLLEAIAQGLKKGEKITLTGFGTFKIAKRKARTGRNPRTGEAIQIKASKTAQFTAGKALKAAVA